MTHPTMNPARAHVQEVAEGGECPHGRRPPPHRQPARGPEHSAGHLPNARTCPARQVAAP
eukprot:9274541-Alexandrium_andersonii.AAC.1